MSTRSYHMPATPLARLRRLSEVVIAVNHVDVDLSRFIQDQEVKTVQDLEDLIVTMFNNYDAYRRQQRGE